MKRTASDVGAPLSPQKRQHVGDTEVTQCRFSENEVELPWFVPLIGQAEEIFGGLVFQFLSRKDYGCYSALPAVCKWFHNVFWDSLEYLTKVKPPLSSLSFIANKSKSSIKSIVLESRSWVTFQYKDLLPFTNITNLHLRGMSTFDLKDSYLNSFSALKHLSLIHAMDMTPNLSIFTQLESLKIIGPGTDKTTHIRLFFEALNNATQLKSLELQYGRINEPAYEEFLHSSLTDFVNLTKLRLGPTRLQRYNVLHKLTNLESLTLPIFAKTDYTRTSLEILHPLKKLRKLDLLVHTVEAEMDNFLEPLTKNSNLRKLTLRNAETSTLKDWGLGKLTQLRQLKLFITCDGQDLKCLTALKNLELFDFSQMPVETDDGFLRNIMKLSSLTELRMNKLLDWARDCTEYHRLPKSFPKLRALHVASGRDLNIGKHYQTLRKQSAIVEPVKLREQTALFYFRPGHRTQNEGIVPLLRRLERLSVQTLQQELKFCLKILCPDLDIVERPKK